MIKQFIKSDLAKECTLVKVDSKVVLYKGNTYELKHLGCGIRKQKDTKSRIDVLRHAKNLFYECAPRCINASIIHAIADNVTTTKKILLKKDEVIKISKNNKMICNSKTVEQLDKFNIKYPKEDLIIVEEIYGDKVYIVNLKDILFFYTKDVKPRVLNKGYLQVELMCIYARAYLDRNKDVKIVEIEIKE